MPNEKEIITINVGGAGNNIGREVVDQYRKEYEGHDYSSTFFTEISTGVFRPRCLWVDLDPSVRSVCDRADIDPFYVVAGNDDAAKNFARGHYTVGKKLMHDVNDRIRKLVDGCDNVQGFMMNHSLGGGTGSGLGTAILERLAVDYRKKSKVGFEVLSGDMFGKQRPVQAYNELFATHWLLDHTDVSFMFDNFKMGKIADGLGVANTYQNINTMMAKAISSITAGLRFPGDFTALMVEYQQNLVAFPRLHFITPSVANFMTPKRKGNVDSPTELVNSAVDPKNFLVDLPNFDGQEDKYTGMTFQAFGGVKRFHNAVNDVTRNPNVSFASWSPTGVKGSEQASSIPHLSGQDVGVSQKCVTMLGNNVGISRKFNATAKKYDKLYSQRAFVHLYVGEGMDESEFSEAREDIGFLEKDYLDVVTEQASDDEDGGEDF